MLNDYAARYGHVEMINYFLDNILGKIRGTGLTFVMHEKCDIGRLLTHSVKNKQYRCVRILMKYLDVSSNIDILFKCLDHLLDLPCRLSFSLLIGYFSKIGLSTFNASTKLLKKAINISVDKFITTMCFSLRLESSQHYGVLNLLYAIIVLGYKYKNSKSEQFMLRIQLHFLCTCLGGDDTLSYARILYFASTHGFT